MLKESTTLHSTTSTSHSSSLALPTPYIPHNQTLAMFLVASINKIASDKELRRAKNANLRQACAEALDLVKITTTLEDGDGNSSSSQGQDGGHLPPLRQPSSQQQLLSDQRLLQPFLLACSMQQSPRLVIVGIDSLQKLIAYGHVSNDAVAAATLATGSPPPPAAADGQGQGRLIEAIVKKICSCFQGVQTDAGVQLQILKALLTVITSSVVEVHEADLLLIVRTCYDIFMASKQPVNQATARATLTQIVNLLFSRMEQVSLDASLATPNPSSMATSPATDSGSDHHHRRMSFDSSSVSVSFSTVFDDGVDETGAAAKSTNENGSLSGDDDQTSSSTNTPPPSCNNDAITTNGSSASLTTAESSDESSEYIESVVRACLTTLVDKVVVETDGNQPVINGHATPTNHKSPNDQITVDCEHVVLPATAITHAHIAQKDAFLVFRSLCRLASKDFTGGSNDKSNTVKSKTLSLQLLLSIFNQVGPLFLSSDLFIAAIKQYLCPAIVKNGLSPSLEVCRLSFQLFQALLNHFKSNIKRHIEAFFKDVILHLLLRESSPFDHKKLAVDSLNSMLDSGANNGHPRSFLVDLYLNYDCNLGSTNVFEQLVGALAKLAAGQQQKRPGNSDDADSSSTGHHPMTVGQRHALRQATLDCLVRLLGSMVDWANELYLSPESQSFLGADTVSASSDAAAMSCPRATLDDNSTNPGNDSDNTSLQQEAVDATSHHDDDDPGQFESRKVKKGLYESAVSLFNHAHPPSSAAWRAFKQLAISGLMPDDPSPEDVANLLATEPNLSKSRVGDFLGDNDPFNLKVMDAFVDRFNFSNKQFLSSIREFLSSFRLPGEAQKIDRLMEKFAARYCLCNPQNSLFTSADTAYVLAFSVIMLTTDLHSGKIKSHQHMTKLDYIRMNRGINESGDLPEDYLGQIYDQIAECGIELKESESRLLTRLAGRTSSSSANQQPADGPPNDDSTSVCSNESGGYTSATHCEHIRPMFRLAWSPFLAAFSVSLQDCDDLTIARLALTGIRHAIRIACLFNLYVERDAYVQALARFTLLLTTTTSGPAPIAPGQSTPESMKKKNIETIKTLIGIAQTDGNYLGKSWLEILRCISQLESTHLLAPSTTPSPGTVTGFSASPPSLLRNGTANTSVSAGSLSRPSTINETSLSIGHTKQSTTLARSTSSVSGHSRSTSSGQVVAPGSLAAASVDLRKAAVLQEVMGETGSQSVLVGVDKLFTGSIRLNGTAIVDFVQALCQVSREELNLAQPRMFSLQKLVEISYYNLGRIRLQWSRIWEHIGSHFTQAATESVSEDVAAFVIDSLRQLAVKMIEKGELPNFHFQKEFLRPFFYILHSNRSSAKRYDLVMLCLSHLVRSQHPQLRSGWVNILAGLHCVALSSNANLVDLAFSTTAFIIDSVLPHDLPHLVHAFQPLIKLLADFACNLRFPDIGMESIELMRKCGQLVADRELVFGSSALAADLDNLSTSLGSPLSRESTVPSVATAPISPSNESEDSTTCKDLVWLRGWVPVFCELSRVISSCKLDVRTRALTVLFDLLRTYGSSFKPSWWQETFSILLRVFQPWRRQSEGSDDDVKQKSGVPGTLSTPPQLTSHERLEWLDTTCNHTLFSILDIFIVHFDKLGDLLLADVLAQLRWCCLQEHEQLARSGASCLELLLISCGSQFTPQMWRQSIDLVIDLFTSTTPHDLMTWSPHNAGHNSSPSDSNPPPPVAAATSTRRAALFASLSVKCVVQFELIRAVDHFLFSPTHSKQDDEVNREEAARLCNIDEQIDGVTDERSEPLNGDDDDTATTWSIGPTLIRIPARRRRRRMGEVEKKRTTDNDQEQTSNNDGVYSFITAIDRLRLAKCLLESHSFAKQFNSNDRQRTVLFESGFKGKGKPNLMNQETHSLMCALRILFRMVDEDESVRQETEDLLNRVIIDAIAYYRSHSVDGHRQAWEDCLILILTNLVYFTPKQRFVRHASRLYASVCDLIIALPCRNSSQQQSSSNNLVAGLVRLVLLRSGSVFVTTTAP